MKRREAALPTGPALPGWLSDFAASDWLDLSEPLPPDVRALALANRESFEIEAGFARRARALVRWRAAAEAWCFEHNVSFAVTVLDWSHPAPGEVASGVPPPPP